MILPVGWASWGAGRLPRNLKPHGTGMGEVLSVAYALVA